MPFYEVIYEDGTHGVMCTDSEEEMLDGVSEQHRRATAGEKGGPAQDAPAERVVKVLRYDTHPDDFNVEQIVTGEELKAALKDSLEIHSEDGAVSLPIVLADLRLLSSPMVDSAPHDSNYKMAEVEEISPKKWGGE